MIAALMMTSVAIADGDADDGPSRRDAEPGELDWMPTGAFQFGAYTQSISGRTSASASTIQSGNGDSYISEIIGFEGRLHTPFQLEVPTRPRLYLTAGFQIPLAEGLIAERIEANFDRSPPGQPSPSPAFLANCANQIPAGGGGLADGQTCSLRIRNRVTIEAMWNAGLGIDLTLPVLENQFHIMPSIEYFGMAVQSVGEFRRTTAGNPGVNDFIEIADAVGDAEIYHGVSPALTFLVDVYEEGSFRWSMFAQGRVIFFLNEPDVQSTSSLGQNDITFTIGIDDFAPQGTMGFQVTYTGKRRGGRR